MGVGKTAVAQAVSRIFQMPWVDTDQWIQQHTGCSPAEILRGPGETSLRSAERRAVEAVSRMQGTVIATGGGVPLDPENLALLSRTGVLILLDACPAQLVKRLRASDEERPLLPEIQEQVILERLQARSVAYARIPLRVQTDHRQIEDVAREVYQLFVRHARPSGF